MNYRTSAGRAAEALALKGQKAKALEILDLASREIPVEKYNDPRSVSAIIFGYIAAGEEQKGLKLAEQMKKDIFSEYDYYLSLSKREQNLLRRQMVTQPMLYSMVVQAVVSGYESAGKKDKGYQYLVNSISVIDKRFDNFIKKLEMMGKEQAFEKSEEVQNITPFYQFLFPIMEPFDSTYEKEKTQKITQKVISVTE